MDERGCDGCGPRQRSFNGAASPHALSTGGTRRETETKSKLYLNSGLHLGVESFVMGMRIEYSALSESSGVLATLGFARHDTESRSGGREIDALFMLQSHIS